MLVLLLIAYLALLLALTVVVRRRHGAQDPRVFFVAGGRLSALTTGCSLTATSVGGSSTVLLSALVYKHGLAGVWIDLAGALGFLLLGLFVARRVRASEVSSIAELAGSSYGPGVRRATAALVVIAEIGWLALLGKATAALLLPAFPGVGELPLLAAALAAVIAYTLLGGQYVVSYSDVAQIGVMLVGLCGIAPFYAASAVGAGRLAELRWEFPFSASFGAAEAGSFLLLTGLPHLVGSDIYAKLLSARDGRAAARGAALAAALKLAFAAAITFVALCGAQLFPQLARPSALLGTVVHELLPSGIAAVVLVALVATMMSSADQVLLSAITMVDHDLLREGSAASRASSAIGFGLLSFLLAAWVPTVIDLMKVAYTVFTSALALPLLAGLYPRLAPTRGGVVPAMIAGALVGGGLHIARLAGFTAIPGPPIFWGVALNLLLLLALGRR